MLTTYPTSAYFTNTIPYISLPYQHNSLQQPTLPTQFPTSAYLTNTIPYISLPYQHNSLQQSTLPTQFPTSVYLTNTIPYISLPYQHNSLHQSTLPTQFPTSAYLTNTIPYISLPYQHNFLQQPTLPAITLFCVCLFQLLTALYQQCYVKVENVVRQNRSDVNFLVCVLSSQWGHTSTVKWFILFREGQLTTCKHTMPPFFGSVSVKCKTIESYSTVEC